MTGRIVLTHQALPAVQPINFTLSRSDIMIKQPRTSRLATAAADTVVTFETDDYDTQAETGWSVVAVGRTRRVTGPRETAALKALPLRTWAPVERDTFIRARPELITGHQIGDAAEITRGPASAALAGANRAEGPAPARTVGSDL